MMSKSDLKTDHFPTKTLRYKFSMCLPPKTGCTNWQRGMVSLLKKGETSPEELSDYEVFYDLDRFNSTDMRKERAMRGSGQGYLTME